MSILLQMLMVEQDKLGLLLVLVQSNSEKANSRKVKRWNALIDQLQQIIVTMFQHEPQEEKKAVWLLKDGQDD